MRLTAVWSADHALHEPSGEVWIGLPLVGDEVPTRGVVMWEVITELGLPVVGPTPHGTEPVHRVHDAHMVSYLETAYQEWEEAGYPQDPGQRRIVPYLFPHPDAVADIARHWPTSRAARAGVYCMDTTTVIGPGTYRAARAAVDCALTAADIVLGGGRLAYAAVRPPGHHAGTTFFGGSCYLNNAAITAQYLVDESGGPVAILDIDAHHGNGTQQIFYRRGEVLYASIHIDPGAGWFPHFVGFADETGVDAGEGANLNLPLAPGDGDEDLLHALEIACQRIFGHAPEVVVVSLGLDMATADENSPLHVSARGFEAAADMIQRLGIPTVLVQEGGYDLPSLRADLTATLSQLSPAGGANHGLDPMAGTR